MWILKGKADEMYRSMWEAAMDEMIKKLIFTAKTSGLVYVAEMSGHVLRPCPPITPRLLHTQYLDCCS